MQKRDFHREALWFHMNKNGAYAPINGFLGSAMVFLANTFFIDNNSKIWYNKK